MGTIQMQQGGKSSLSVYRPLTNYLQLYAGVENMYDYRTHINMCIEFAQQSGLEKDLSKAISNKYVQAFGSTKSELEKAGADKLRELFPKLSILEGIQYDSSSNLVYQNRVISARAHRVFLGVRKGYRAGRINLLELFDSFLPYFSYVGHPVSFDGLVRVKGDEIFRMELEKSSKSKLISEGNDTNFLYATALLREAVKVLGLDFTVEKSDSLLDVCAKVGDAHSAIEKKEIKVWDTITRGLDNTMSKLDCFIGVCTKLGYFDNPEQQQLVHLDIMREEQQAYLSLSFYWSLPFILAKIEELCRLKERQQFVVVAKIDRRKKKNEVVVLHTDSSYADDLIQLLNIAEKKGWVTHNKIAKYPVCASYSIEQNLLLLKTQLQNEWI